MLYFFAFIYIGSVVSSAAFSFSCYQRRPLSSIALKSANHDEGTKNKNLYNTKPRLFVGQLETSLKPSMKYSRTLKSKSIIKLSIEQTHYLSKVMRLFSKKKRNEEADALVRIFDGINGEWLCRVIPQNTNVTNQNPASNKKQRRQKNVRSDVQLEAECLIQLRKQESIQGADNLSLPWLFFAPIKKQRAKFMVEKCVELGVGMFCPVESEFTDSAAINACVGNVDDAENSADAAVMFQNMKAKSKSNSDVEKLSLIACEAAEQSERLDVPAFVTSLEEGLEKTLSIQKLLDLWIDPYSSLGKDRMLMVCRERTESRKSVLSIVDAIRKASKQNFSIAYLVGPEGGWSQNEEKMFDQYCETNPESIVGVSLGTNVLRAETASMMAVGSSQLWSSSHR